VTSAGAPRRSQSASGRTGGAGRHSRSREGAYAQGGRAPRAGLGFTIGWMQIVAKQPAILPVANGLAASHIALLS